MTIPIRRLQRKSVAISAAENDRMLREVADGLSGLDHFFPPDICLRTLPGNNCVQYHLNLAQRLFLVLNSPNDSKLGQYFQMANVLLVLASVINMICSTVPQFQEVPETCAHPACNNSDLCVGYQICAPQARFSFEIFEIFAVSIFTLDFAVRFFLSGIMPARLAGVLGSDFEEKERVRAESEKREPNYDPKYSYFYQVFLYIFTFQGIIDICTIFPTWILLAHEGNTLSVEVGGLQTFRVLRVFRLFNSHGPFVSTVKLLYTAFAMSIYPLAVFTFSFALLMIIGATVIFECEAGKFEVTNDYPGGAFLRVSLDRYTPSPTPSVYDSIPTSMYFMGVTLATLGYGDLFPYTRQGRAFAVIFALLGVVLFSLPMSVVASNFDQEYRKQQKLVEIKSNFISAIEKEREEVNHAEVETIRQSLGERFDHNAVKLIDRQSVALTMLHNLSSHPENVVDIDRAPPNFPSPSGIEMMGFRPGGLDRLTESSNPMHSGNNHNSTDFRNSTIHRPSSKKPKTVSFVTKSAQPPESEASGNPISSMSLSKSTVVNKSSTPIFSTASEHGPGAGSDSEEECQLDISDDRNIKSQPSTDVPSSVDVTKYLEMGLENVSLLSKEELITIAEQLLATCRSLKKEQEMRDSQIKQLIFQAQAALSTPM